MGNREWGKGGAVFRQSLFDFPCPVVLGKDTPSFGLRRFKQGLRFVPPDDEGFALRGDGRRLVYKGRRRSHRFTVLGDNSFEYDCILLREPDSNVISLRMEGAEYFDFFRQPDFVKDDFLKGSFAVYKKETLIGEGTGKLCHIHRPEIIDARGRRCWGELSVAGDELRVTIPEWFLSVAKYPVVVDPVIGTDTIGLQDTTAFMYGSGYTEDGLMGALAVNRYLLKEELSGTATAYLYVSIRAYINKCKPVLYSDDKVFLPSYIRSVDEGNIDVSLEKPQLPEWRTATFNIDTNIQSGKYVWFGISAAKFFFRFDYGLTMFWYAYANYEANLPDTFPLFPDQRNYNYKMSAYFTYNDKKNYVRTLTQGVTLYSTGIVKADYKRLAIQTVGISGFLIRSVKFIRRCVMNAANSMCIGITDSLILIRNYFRVLYSDAHVISETIPQGNYCRKVIDNVKTNSFLFRHLFLFIKIMTTSIVKVFILRRFLIAREELTLKSCITRELILESRII